MWQTYFHFFSVFCCCCCSFVNIAIHWTFACSNCNNKKWPNQIFFFNSNTLSRLWSLHHIKCTWHFSFIIFLLLLNFHLLLSATISFLFCGLEKGNARTIHMHKNNNKCSLFTHLSNIWTCRHFENVCKSPGACLDMFLFWCYSFSKKLKLISYSALCWKIMSNNFFVGQTEFSFI